MATVCLEPQALQATGRRSLIRILLFLWSLAVACPIRYWPIKDSVDNTWVFALNYAAAKGLALGRDIIWTTGPLGYLVFPMDVGSNLEQGFAFQCALWLVLAAILVDLYFWTGLPLKNLSLFAMFFGLSAPLYWFNYMGLENLLVTGVFVLLLTARIRGSRIRFAAAAVLTGVIPLIKLTGGMIAGAAILGYLVEAAVRKRRGAWFDFALGAIIPTATMAAGCWLTLPSFEAFRQFVRGSMEIIGGYSAAMSYPGDPMEFLGVLDILVAIGAFLFVRTNERTIPWFLVALFSLPLLISIKHGFVRQDIHVINFFSFAGLVLAVCALSLQVSGKRSIVAFLVALNVGILSLEYMAIRVGPRLALAEASGFRGLLMAAEALHFDSLRANLRAQSRLAVEGRLEPEIRAAVGDAPVASLSVVYSGAFLDDANLQIYPVVQRYSAYTPYLDELNAVWVRNRGPRYLVFDGLSIDERHPWAETPAMWREIFRWYDARLKTSRTVLLMRRANPRFTGLRPVGQLEFLASQNLGFPPSQQPLFASVTCSTNPIDTIRSGLARPAPVQIGKYRAVVAVLASPTLVNFRAGNLNEIGALFDQTTSPLPAEPQLKFSGAEFARAGRQCQARFFETVSQGKGGTDD